MNKAKPQLDWEKLNKVTNFIAELRHKSDSPALQELYQFLLDLRSVYIECSRCGRMIAPLEMYYIGDEEAWCERCNADG
jgi:uncharacterized OB-fold protein